MGQQNIGRWRLECRSITSVLTTGLQSVQSTQQNLMTAVGQVNTNQAAVAKAAAKKIGRPRRNPLLMSAARGVLLIYELV